MLRLNEHYISVQGEGPRTGILTQFVRFAGCNMRCPGWPCDTPHAIDPKIWRYDSEKLDPTALAERIDDAEVQNVCLTGGEPFMQDNADLWEFTHDITASGHTVEVFTNGSYLFPEWALETMDFMMDWKLEGSGEAKTSRAIRLMNALKLGPRDGIKFVIKDMEDLKEATAMSVILQNEGTKAKFWVGAAWGCIAEDSIVDYIKDMGVPWRLNVQMHKYIWPATARKV